MSEHWTCRDLHASKRGLHAWLEGGTSPLLQHAASKGGEEAIGASGLQTSRQPTCMVRLFTDALSIDTEADPQSEYHTASTGPTHT
jgi:hypothetical protein